MRLWRTLIMSKDSGVLFKDKNCVQVHYRILYNQILIILRPFDQCLQAFTIYMIEEKM
jgi:hypothetical protein